MTIKSRRQRRQEARINGTPFIPQYNDGKITVQGRSLPTGGAPKTYEEMYGVGYERFDGRYVKIGALVSDNVSAINEGAIK